MRMDHLRCAARRAVGVSLAVAAVAAATAGAANAQVAGQPVSIQVGRLSSPQTTRADDLTSPQSRSIRRSLETLDYGSLVLEEKQTQPSTRRSSVGRKILGGALGAVGGFFAGGYIGAKIEGTDCGCDDPGFKGAVIGAPIGAVVGGILGVRFF
jgi:hypothetical protein